MIDSAMPAAIRPYSIAVRRIYPSRNGDEVLTECARKYTRLQLVLVFGFRVCVDHETKSDGQRIAPYLTDRVDRAGSTCC